MCNIIQYDLKNILTSNKNVWLKWIESILIFDLFIVIFGAIFFFFLS